MRRRWMIVALALVIAGCAATRPLLTGTFRIKGSDTMIILAQRWAEEYMRLNPGVSIYAEGGGTATGIEALIRDEAEICTASRPFQPDEVRRLMEQQRSLGISHLVAKDALSIYLHPDNPVRNLTVEQVRGIFTGRVTNWSMVGGNEAEIIVLNRSPNSGTYLYFQEHVLEGQAYTASARTMSGTAAIVKAVMENRNAIGYGGIAYGREVVHCHIDGIAPTEENVRNGSYPIARYLHLYTLEKPKGVTKSFIDWVLSREGQMTVKKVGYIPLMEVR